MNGYGYGNCGFCAAWLKALCTVVGVEVRIQEIWGHTVNEVYYDGAWHYLDSNCKVYYLSEDNRTIASLAQLEHNPGLVERTLHSHDPWVRQPDSLSRNQEFIKYICTWGDNYIEDGYDDAIYKDYKMSYTLKPGKSLSAGGVRSSASSSRAEKGSADLRQRPVDLGAGPEQGGRAAVPACDRQCHHHATG